MACLTEALGYNANAYVEPAALLCPDEGGQWQQVIGRISERRPLVRLGDYEPTVQQGPAYCVRCVVAGGTVDAGFADGRLILYLAGVARSELRAVDTCPATLAPIAELQYRSQWYSHPNGRDWSVRSLLSHSERGLVVSRASNRTY